MQLSTHEIIEILQESDLIPKTVKLIEVETLAQDLWDAFNQECQSSYDDGHKDGREAGYADGHDDGRAEGYDEGYEAAQDASTG